ncbi:hypothetical protein GCM10009839_15560 [Catenulispora yoronensis]|uniref:Uncharacterized protein n=1 Tax=Catenulispora yoronensis TaxID=450799 RepID=A0ABN2TSK3_9ACTN
MGCRNCSGDNKEKDEEAGKYWRDSKYSLAKVPGLLKLGCEVFYPLALISSLRISALSRLISPTAPGHGHQL